MLALFLKLLIAHTIGDFVLQPNSWIADKRKRKFRSKKLYFHGFIHLLLLLIVLQFDASYWLTITLIVISHLIIDLAKLYLEDKLNSRLLFMLDQAAHLCVISWAVYIQTPYRIAFEKLYATPTLLLILAIILITFVAAILMKIIMSNWIFEEDKKEESLKNAGKYIGILERLFVFIFIVLNQWGAIGFLIAAKSIFRFSDLSRAKDRKLTEYILIGTLISYGIAIVVGILYQYFIKIL